MPHKPAFKRYPSEGGITEQPLVNVFRYLSGRPGPTGFGSHSTGEEVVQDWDGTGKVVAITGASGGLGGEISRVMANRGATVIMLVRNTNAGEAVASSIRAANPTADVRVIKCELESLKSVADSAKQVLDMKLPLHILILNAGIMAPPFGLTQDGIEQQIGVNHVAHVLLTRCLMPTILRTASVPGAPQGRVVVTCSSGHMMAARAYGIRPFQEINNSKGYKPLTMYGESKLSNLLFTRELNQRLKAAGITNVVVVSCHPGMVPHTSLSRNLGIPGCMQPFLNCFFHPFSKDLTRGSATQVFLGTTAKVTPGEYYIDCNIAPASSQSHNADLGAKLWSWTNDQISPFLSKDSVDVLPWWTK